MGNQQNKLLGIEVKSRFTKEELHMLQKIYQDLSARSLNAITKEVFMEFFPISGLWGEKLFEFFDESQTGKLTFEDFVLGLLACCKTSKEAKIKLLFSLYDMNHDGCIEKNEVLAMLYNYPKDHIRDILDEVAPDKGTKLNRITEEQREAAVDKEEWKSFHKDLKSANDEPKESKTNLPVKEKFDKTLEQFGLTQSVTYNQSTRTTEIIIDDRKVFYGNNQVQQVSKVEEQKKEEQSDKEKLGTKDAKVTQASTLNSRVKRYNSLMFKAFGEDRTKLSFEEFSGWINNHPVLLEIFDEAFYQNIWGVEKSEEANAQEKLGDSQAFIEQKLAKQEKEDKKFKVGEIKREDLHGLKLRYHSIKPVISGELFKLGKRTKAWKQRLYEVRDDFLFFYKKNDKEIPKRMVFLEGCFVEELKDSETTHKFGLKIGYKCETYPEYRIYCNTKAELDEWLKVLKDQSNFMIHGRYAFKEKIGAGGSSFVYRAVGKIEPGKEQAIKVVNKKNLALGQREQILVEVALLRSLSHPNIIKIHEVVETRRYLYIVSDIAKGGDLFSHVIHNGPLEEKLAALIMLQLVQAVDYLHESGFIHRDLKPENILLVPDQDNEIKQIKIIDFASAKFVNNINKLYETCGSANYTAPEVLWGKGYGNEIDTWSVGVIMYFTLRGLLPFDAQEVDAVLQNTLSKEVDLNEKFWNGISLEAKDLLRRLLEKDPAKRITIKKALEHSWFDLDAHKLNRAEEMMREDEDHGYMEEVFIIEDATPRQLPESVAHF